MKQSEKLDLILRELYKTKNDGTPYSISDIFRNLNIPLDSTFELLSIAELLKDDGFIKSFTMLTDCDALLTSRGIKYCEENSYSNPGHSILTNNYSV